MKATSALPLLSIETDGAAVSDGVARSIVAVRVRQRLSLPTLCEITLADPPREVWQSNAIAPGTSLRVATRERSETLFVGEVAAVEYRYDGAQERVVRVRGYDLLHRLGKRQPVRGHVQVSAPALLRELVGDLGLRVSADDEGPTWSRVMQYGPAT